MPNFWLDADSLITPKNGPYGFDIAPGFWKFLEQKAAEGTIASSITVYSEIEEGAEDDLLQWAKNKRKWVSSLNQTHLSRISSVK